MELPVPTILPLRVQVPSTPSTLLSFIVFVLYFSEEKNENKPKRSGLAHFFKKRKRYLAFDDLEKNV